MMAFVATMLGSFTTPMRIGTDPASMLWLLPLVVSIAVVYKSTKVYRIEPWPFARESAVLVGSIIVFIVVAAVSSTASRGSSRSNCPRSWTRPPSDGTSEH